MSSPQKNLKKYVSAAVILGIAALIFYPLSSMAYTFYRTLSVGSTGADVTMLQKVLNSNASTTVALSGTGSLGNEGTYFGQLTKQAVIAFQNLYRDDILTPVGLTQGSGFVGTMTLKKLNEIAASSTLFGTSTVSQQTVTVTTTVAPPAALSPTLTTSSITAIPVITSLSTTTIQNGTLVTIYGQNFLPTGNTVLLSIDLPDKYANISTASSTSLQLMLTTSVSSKLQGAISKFSPKIQQGIIDKIRTVKTASSTMKDGWYIPATISVKNVNGFSNAVNVNVNILANI